MLADVVVVKAYVEVAIFVEVAAFFEVGLVVGVVVAISYNEICQFHGIFWEIYT